MDAGENPWNTERPHGLGDRTRWSDISGYPPGRYTRHGAIKPCEAVIEPMKKKIARTLRSHRALLLNYFKARKQFSSGVIEGLNNKAKVTMRRSYGFRTFRILELALYHSLGKLPEPELTHEFF